MIFFVLCLATVTRVLVVVRVVVVEASTSLQTSVVSGVGVLVSVSVDVDTTVRVIVVVAVSVSTVVPVVYVVDVAGPKASGQYAVSNTPALTWRSAISSRASSLRTKGLDGFLSGRHFA